MTKIPKTKPEKLKSARKWVRDMQKVLPCCERVYVIAAEPDEDAGGCSKRRRGFELSVDWDHTWAVIVNFLLPHEYAHARVWGRMQMGNNNHDGHFYLELGVVDKASLTLAPHET